MENSGLAPIRKNPRVEAASPLYASPRGAKYPWPPIGGLRAPLAYPLCPALSASPQGIRPQPNFGSGLVWGSRHA
jgi:hypothetical protein